MIRYTIKAIRVHAEHPDNEVVFTIVDLGNVWEVARWHMQQRWGHQDVTGWKILGEEKNLFTKVPK